MSTVFLALLRREGLPVPDTEYRFHPTRRFRLDFAWPDYRLGLEVDGGVWTGGKHGRGTGIVKDQEKTNEAAALGWRILRVTPANLVSTQTVRWIRESLRYYGVWLAP